MRLKAWFILGIASVIVGGCATETNSVEQPSESPIAQATESPVASPASPSPSEGPEVLKSGTFASGEHPTEGTVRLVSQNDVVSLELDASFTTSNLGPDLVVILHRSDDVLGSTQPPAYPIQEGDYVLLAPLKEFSGAQSYPIPDTVNLADYQSAAIWCRQFNATFGAAVLR